MKYKIMTVLVFCLFIILPTGAFAASNNPVITYTDTGDDATHHYEGYSIFHPGRPDEQRIPISGTGNHTYNNVGWCTLCHHTCSHSQTSIIPAIEATCTTTGYTSGEKCIYCSLNIISPSLLPINNNHSSLEMIPEVEPSYYHDGHPKYWNCNACGGIFLDNIDFFPTTLEEIRIPALEPIPDLVLPSSLQIVNEEAFYGCAFFYVKLSDNITTIQNRAFLECPNLEFIFIPESVTSISDFAFDNEDLYIRGKINSYAEQYATNHGYHFIIVE